MDALTVIRRLSDTSSRIDKEQIIFDAFMQGHREFFVGALLAYDPLITFGVKKVALIEEDDGEPGTLTFQEFLALAHKLRKRELTGHAARDAINDAASRCHVPTWNDFYRRVLLKDFKAGIETKTINKVLKKIVSAEPGARDYMIPMFMAQLAEDGAEGQPAAKHIRGKKMLDPKFNGVRLLSVLDKEAGQVTQFTGRNGKVNENFTEVRAALEEVLKELPGSVVLDGEIVAGSFQELMTQINRKENRDTSKTRLAVFDIIPLADFHSGFCKISQADRHQMLCELETSGLLQKATGGLVYAVPKVTVDLDTPEGRAEAQRITEEAIEAGFEEAVMYKDPSAPYECGKRTVHWLKRKPFIEVSLEVVGVERGDPEGKFKDTLGALVLKGVDMGVQIETKCGGGLSDELRHEIWANPDEYIGMIAEIRGDALSLEQNGEVYSVRFPRFKGWRGTEKGEKL